MPIREICSSYLLITYFVWVSSFTPDDNDIFDWVWLMTSVKQVFIIDNYNENLCFFHQDDLKVINNDSWWLHMTQPRPYNDPIVVSQWPQDDPAMTSRFPHGWPNDDFIMLYYCPWSTLFSRVADRLFKTHKMLSSRHSIASVLLYISPCWRYIIFFLIFDHATPLFCNNFEILAAISTYKISFIVWTVSISKLNDVNI